MTKYPPAFKFSINVPATVRIKFVDVRPGKPWTDPQGDTKMLPPQVSIKGTFDGAETMCFLPGKVWANLKALTAAGIIEQQDTDVLEETDVLVNIPLIAHEEFIATLSKPASEKYANMVYRPVGGAAPVVSKRVQPPSGGAKNQPFDLPARAEIPLPNEDGPPADDESAYADGDFDWQNGEFHKPDGTPRAAPTETPRETAADALKTQKRDAIENAFLALWQRVAVFQRSISGELEIPIDGVSVNACASTIWIDQQKKGLV